VLVPGVLLTLLWSHEAACLLLVALSLLAASSVLLSLSVTLLLAPCESATPLTLVERTALLLLVPIAKRLSPLLLCGLLLVERLSPLLPCRLPIVERLAVAPPSVVLFSLVVRPLCISGHDNRGHRGYRLTVDAVPR